MPSIYALVDPETDSVRYVGKANRPEVRLINHLNEIGSTRKCRWVAALVKRGLGPRLIILEDVAEEVWQEAEVRWIVHFRSEGADLTNLTDGGEGLTNASIETREKLSLLRRMEWSDLRIRQAKLLILKSPERAAKISAALRGKPKSPKHIAKLLQNQPGRSLTEEHKAKIRVNSRGHRWSPEEIKALKSRNMGNQYGLGNISRKGQKQSLEECRKKSEAMKGVPKSPEHREKLRIAALRRWARERGETTNDNLPEGL